MLYRKKKARALQKNLRVGLAFTVHICTEHHSEKQEEKEETVNRKIFFCNNMSVDLLSNSAFDYVLFQ